jgi:hypothetical protein
MQVTAILTPRSQEWRWRITDYEGATVEESAVGFSTIAAAIAAGRQRLAEMSAIDRSDSRRAWLPGFGRR